MFEVGDKTMESEGRVLTITEDERLIGLKSGLKRDELTGEEFLTSLNVLSN